MTAATLATTATIWPMPVRLMLLVLQVLFLGNSIAEINFMI